MFALISTEDLEAMNQLLVKQLKNRYNDPTVNKKFVIGIDRAKMRLYDLETTAQQNLTNTGIKVNLDSAEEETVDRIMSKVKKLRDFSAIKV